MVKHKPAKPARKPATKAHRAKAPRPTRKHAPPKRPRTPRPPRRPFIQQPLAATLPPARLAPSATAKARKGGEYIFHFTMSEEMRLELVDARKHSEFATTLAAVAREALREGLLVLRSRRTLRLPNVKP